MRKNSRSLVTDYLLDNEILQTEVPDYLFGEIDRIYHIWVIGKCYLYKDDAVNIHDQEIGIVEFYEKYEYL